MTFEEARAWLDTTEFEREMASADEASDDALEEASSVLSAMSAFGSTHTSALQGLVRSHERACQALTAAIRDVVDRRARDARELSRSFVTFDTTLVALEEGVSRYGALVRANISTVVASLCAAFIAYQTNMRRRCRDLLPDLRRLDELLHDMQDDVENARGRRVINTTIDICASLTGPAGRGARLAFSVAVSATQTLIEYAFRASGTSPVETEYRIAVSASQDCSNASSAFGSALSTLDSFISRSSEITIAEERLRNFRRMLPNMQRDLRALNRFLSSEIQSLDVARALYQGALQNAERERARFRSSAPDRRSLAQRFASIR